VCVIVCDLDRFKEVNDAYGHDRGDKVLRDCTYEIRKALRSFELAYRVGGEEFVVLLPGLDVAQGAEVAARLREAIEGAHPGGLELTMSVGVAAAAGSQVSGEPLFRAADAALYRAKAAGRNRVEVTPPVDAEANGDARLFRPDGGAVELAS
jgi:diguanylate cyclase (GGDEF)-like protein